MNVLFFVASILLTGSAFAKNRIYESYQMTSPQKKINLNAISSEDIKSFGAYGGNENSFEKITKQRVFCGPSSSANSLYCFDLNNHAVAQFYPIPGNLSSIPLYSEEHKAWFLGTTKGLFLKLSVKKEKQMPDLNTETLGFWGTLSRHFVFLYKNFLKKESEQKGSSPFNTLYEWAYSYQSFFSGQAIIVKDKIFTISQDQVLHALSVKTGEKKWIRKLSIDRPLLVQNSSLVSEGDDIYVGSNSGQVLALDSSSGDIKREFKQKYMSFGDENLSSSVGTKPLVEKENILFAGVDSSIQKYNRRNHYLEWSFQKGSIANILSFEDSYIVGSTAGEILALDKKTGHLKWKFSQKYFKAPIKSLIISKKEKKLIAISTLGQLFAVDPFHGKLLGQSHSFGEVNGALFQGRSEDEYCVSFANLSLKCFRVSSLR
jgi:hypothetical protein